MWTVGWLDDEIHALKPLIFLLEQTGQYRIKPYTTPAQLWKALAQQRPDILLLDEHIGPDSGLEIAEQIHRQYPDLPIIFVTREDDPAYVRDLIARGWLYYLHKPVHASELIALLTQLTEREALRRQYLGQRLPERYRNLVDQIEQARSWPDWAQIIRQLKIFQAK